MQARSKYDTMSVHDLKQEIKRRGMDSLFCFSKDTSTAHMRICSMQHAACRTLTGTRTRLAPAPRTVTRFINFASMVTMRWS